MLFSSSLHRNLAHPIVLLFLALILVPTIFLPLGIDQSIFARGGEVLFGKGKLYIDYFELKPPLLFLFYGISGIIFGKSDIGYRFFDFIWQLFTIYSLLYIVRRVTKNKNTGIVAAAVYAVLYTSMGHSETMECESFIAPAIVWLIYLISSNIYHSNRTAFVRGALAGFIFGLKFTFGLTFATLLLWEIIEEKNDRLKRLLFVSIGFTVAAGSSLWVLFDFEVLHRYMELLEYNRAYAGSPILGLETVRTILMQLGQFFGDNISLSITIAAALGVGISIKHFYSDLNNRTGKLIRSSVLIFFALLLSIIIERKFNPYHFLRIYVPLSILASLGFSAVFGFLRKNWNSFPVSWRTIIVILGCFALFMSPIPRCIKNTRIMYLYYTSSEFYRAAFQKPDDPALIMVDAHNIATYIRSSSKNGKTFAIATAASYLYRQLNEHPISKLSMPMFYYATITPKGAYKEMIEEVKDSHWLVIQKNDIHPVLFGHSKPSWECVRQDSTMSEILSKSFVLRKEIGAFYVYERNN